jgi:hypothetical protein
MPGVCTTAVCPLLSVRYLMGHSLCSEEQQGSGLRRIRIRELQSGSQCGCSDGGATAAAAAVTMHAPTPNSAVLLGPSCHATLQAPALVSDLSQ